MSVASLELVNFSISAAIGLPCLSRTILKLLAFLPRGNQFEGSFSSGVAAIILSTTLSVGAKYYSLKSFSVPLDSWSNRFKIFGFDYVLNYKWSEFKNHKQEGSFRTLPRCEYLTSVFSFGFSPNIPNPLKNPITENFIAATCTLRFLSPHGVGAARSR